MPEVPELVSDSLDMCPGQCDTGSCAPTRSTSLSPSTLLQQDQFCSWSSPDSTRHYAAAAHVSHSRVHQWNVGAGPAGGSYQQDRISLGSANEQRGPVTLIHRDKFRKSLPLSQTPKCFPSHTLRTGAIG